MIDTSTWKEFNMSDIGFKNFHGIRQKQSDRTEGNTPLLTAGKENQGVASYIGNPPSTYIDSITVDMFGNSFFHKGVYAGDDNIYFFVNDNVSDEAKLFIAAIINTDNTPKYAFKDQFRQPQADALSVHLPATSDGQPDWDYMESYMKAVMKESEKSLENLKKVDDTKHLIDVSGWGEFRVGDLFDVSRPIARSSQKYEKGDMAFVASGCFNNGVTDYLEPKDENDYDEGNCLTVSPVDGYTFYQKDRFLGRGGAGSSIIILRNDMLNELRGKYLSTVIRIACKAWGYSNMGNKDKLADTMISLPIDATGEPDWQYMEDYMKQIMDKSEQIISDLQIVA